MTATRRGFLKALGTAGIASAVRDLSASASGLPDSAEPMGVLVDIPNCIGCRKCEFACQEAAGFKVPPIEAFEDKSVFAAARRPEPSAYTVVNESRNGSDLSLPVYTKVNCLHCNEPACVSACLVGAFEKRADGAVVYDPWKCMGCRYCMIACPFQIPTYDYDNALTPQVRKCNFCADRLARGDVPACVRICPNESLIFGKRSALIALAHDKIRKVPDKYIDHVYGEFEAGGTSWMYLSSVPFEQLSFLNLPSVAPSHLTEVIQHGVFRYFIPPLALYGLLGLIMWIGRRRDDSETRDVRDEGRSPRVARFAQDPRGPASPVYRREDVCVGAGAYGEST